MAYDTNTSVDNLNCADNVDFGKCQDIFRQLSWFKNDLGSKYLDVKSEVFKK